MTLRAVLLDFYGTLADSPAWGPSWEELLGERGYTLPPEVRDLWWNDGLDGTEHDEHSRSRGHYVAWQHSRIHAMLAACGVPRPEAEVLIERVRHIGAHRRITAFDEVVEVLAALRGRGLRLAICSNWDWDLHEAVEAAGLREHVDLLVSSAWVGARKPHPRIYRHTLEQIGVAAPEALFVGDSWGPDVEGPLALGMQAVWVRRDGRASGALPTPAPPVAAEPPAAPPESDPAVPEVPAVDDLRGLLTLLDA